jgi:hypothetical protein
MKRMMRSTSFITATLLALTLLLAACGGSTYSPAPTPTATSVSDVKGDFAGVTNSVNFISLSTDGPLLVAYVCDGTPTHHIMLAQWFKGVVTRNVVSLTAKGGAHLVATLSAQSATGTVTLANGKSFSFTTHALASQKDAGLFRSEQTVGKARYLAGWVLPPGPAAAEAAEQAGGIINEQTGAVLPAPVLTSQDIAAGQVMVPGLGMFPLTRCSLGKCS